MGIINNFSLFIWIYHILFLSLLNTKQGTMKLQVIQITQHELQQQMKHSVHKSKKTYTRKEKHKGK
jgi:hypothetical protein